MNLFASLKETLSEGIVNQIAVQNNEKPEKIQKALDAFSASIVGGLIKRASSESGMKLIFAQAQNIAFTPEQLSKIVKTSAELESFKSSGEKILNTVLPGFKSPVCSMVTKYSGTKNSLASALSGISMSVIITVLKKIVSDKQLNAESLAAFLGEQRESLLTVVPDLNDRIIETVGIQYLLHNFEVPRAEQQMTVAKTTEPISSKQPFLVGVEDRGLERTNFKWVGVGLITVALLGAGAVYFWNQQQTTTITPAAEIEADTLAEARTIQEPIEKKPATIDTATAPPPATPAATSVENPMEVYLADKALPKGKAFKFENVDFEDNTLQLKASANASVQALADLLKKYPTAQIKLVAYANDAKPPLTNKVLSVKRVYALKDQFVKSGISFVRVDAEGRGTGVNPKNTTGSKQVAMREVWVRFVQK